jgi:hypothetical protein
VAKSQYDLCLQVLRRLKDEGILDELVIVGSWCVVLYDEYFKGKGLLPPIRTRDLEFLVPLRPSLRRKIDLHELLKDLGFVIDFKGDEGYTVLAHPDLILEFLLSARGREPQKPRRIDALGIAPKPLRFMDLLKKDTIRVAFGDVEVTAPHPANFALQKLLIARRRKQKEKAEKDRSQAVAALKALRELGEFKCASELYQSMSASRQRAIRQELTALDEGDLLAALSGHV